MLSLRLVVLVDLRLLVEDDVAALRLEAGLERKSGEQDPELAPCERPAERNGTPQVEQVVAEPVEVVLDGLAVVL